MNLIKLFNDELKDKNLSTDEKIRYIYLRCCEIFTYDFRIRFCDILENGDILIKEIKNKKFDIENITTKEVVCTSIENEIFKKLLKEFFDINSTVNVRGHSSSTFFDKKRNLKTDFTISSDISRVKMGLETYGYTDCANSKKFKEELIKMDKKIGYLRGKYFDEIIARRVKYLRREFLKYNHGVMNKKDYFIYKLYTIKEIFDSFNNFVGFYDSHYCIYYLKIKMLDHTDPFINKINLFDKKDDEKWNFYNIYLAPFENDYLYFLLEKNGENFSFYEITKNDALNYVKSMQGINKKLILNN